MSQRAKHVFYTILAQAGCLAVGLFMQLQFLGYSVANDAVEQALGQLQADLETWQSQRSASADVPARASDLARELLPPPMIQRHTFVSVVDPSWLVIDSTFQTDRMRVLAVGAPVGWTEQAGQPVHESRCVRGTLDLPRGVHLAAAIPLQDRAGYIVLHQPKVLVEAKAGGLLASVPLLSGLTFLWTLALLGVLAYMLLARFHDESEKERTRSVAEGLRQRHDLVRTRDAVVFGLAKLADSRDSDTGDHLERISVYSTLLASVLRHHPKYGKEVTPAFARLIGISSALHDIGKVGVEDRILRKPGPLTSDERRRMQTHTMIGGQCLREIEQRLGSTNFLQMAREIAFAHHERWDGTGYPYGLFGEQIPLSARIVAIADVYDALSSRRVYKQPQMHEECVQIIADAAGTQFDPDLVEIWLGIAPKYAEVGRRYSNDGRHSSAVLPPIEEAADGQVELEPTVAAATEPFVTVGPDA